MAGGLFSLLSLSLLLFVNSSIVGNAGSLANVRDQGSTVGKDAAGNTAAGGSVSDTKQRTSMLRGQRSSSATQSESSDGSMEEPPPTCSCECCDATIRRPGEISFGAKVKCTPSSSHTEDMCGAQCSPAKDDKILHDEIIDTQRFCFFECKPAAGAGAPENSQCVALDENEATRVIDPAGNPIDPAFLYSQPDLSQHPPASFFYGTPPVYSFPAANANLLSTHTTYSKAAQPADPGSPSGVDPATAKKEALKGKAFSDKKGDEAVSRAAKLRDVEEVKQQELNEALKASGNGNVALDPLAAVSDLNAAATAARASASQSTVLSSEAIGFYDMGRQKIWKLALAAAGKEVLRWKKYAEEKQKKELEDRFAPTWQAKAAAVAQKASQPYIEGMLRAQESVKLYNTKAFEMAEQANTLWDEAQEEAIAANRLPRKTIKEENVAKAAILEAREKAENAQKMAKESKQYFDTAASVRKGIPSFQYSAQKAANQAVEKFANGGK